MGARTGVCSTDCARRRLRCTTITICMQRVSCVVRSSFSGASGAQQSGEFVSVDGKLLFFSMVQSDGSMFASVYVRPID